MGVEEVATTGVKRVFVGLMKLLSIKKPPFQTAGFSLKVNVKYLSFKNFF